MPDVTKIEWAHLSRLAGIGISVRLIFGKSLPDGPVRKLKKARKWLHKHHAHTISSLPEELRCCFLSEISDEAVFRFLLACDEEYQLCFKENRTPQMLLLQPLGEEVQHAVQAVLDEDCCVYLSPEEGNAILLVEDTHAYSRSLVLENAVFAPENAGKTFINEVAQIQKENDQYILYEWDCGIEREVLRFSSAWVKVECYDCTQSNFFWDDPWTYLKQLSLAILGKAALPGDYCNALEKALLPLLEEICPLGVRKVDCGFPLMIQLAQQVGCPTARLERMLKKWNGAYYGQPGNPLCIQKLEPLWRAIYEKIRQSQEGYPVKVEQHCNRAELQKKRAAIQAFLHQQGFSGQYPDFAKSGDVLGLHLIDSYDQAYLCGMEKDARMYIRCVESWQDNERMLVHFLCGTAMKQKGNQVQDLYSCLFNAKGHRLFWWVRDYECVYDPEIPQTEERALYLAQIAVKKVHMQKLTKEEQKDYSFGSSDGLGLFWLWLLMGGGLFGVGMVVGFILLGSLLFALFGQWQQIPSMLVSYPWGWILLFCWIGFGLPMGLIALFAKRK